MPLPIRDGNQSLTTLSTLIVNSAHVPAHTVVSLGSQAITDIAQAVSGVELGPNSISALEHISVTISAGTSITVGNVVSVTGGLTNAELRASSVTVAGVVTANINGTVPVSGTFWQATQPISVSSLPASTVTVSSIPSISGSVTLGVGTQQIGSVTVSNFPATQTVTFTQASVTFGQAVVSASNIGDLLSSVGTDNTADATTKFLKIGGHQDGQNQTSHIVHVSSGGAMKVDATDSTVTFGAINGTVTVGNSVTISNFPATQAVTFTQASVTFGTAVITGSASIIGTASVTFSSPAVTGTVELGPNSLNALESITVTMGQVTVTGGLTNTELRASAVTVAINNFPATQTVTFGQTAITGSVSVSNFPSTQTIAGTVTANGFDFNNSTYNPIPLAPFDETAGGGKAVVAKIIDDGGSGLNFSAGVPISGTVTANVGSILDPDFTIANSIESAVNVSRVGLLAQNLSDTPSVYGVQVAFEGNDGNANAVTSGNPFPISGTVTASNLPVIQEASTNQNAVVVAGVGTVENQVPVQLAFVDTDGNPGSRLAQWIRDGGGDVPISGTVTVGNSVTIGSLPAISGTVTANGGNFLNADNALITKDSASNIVLVGGLNYSTTPTQSGIDAIRTDGSGAVLVYSSQTNWTDTNAGNQPRSASQQTPFPVQILGGSVTIGNTVTARLQDASGNNLTSTTIGGSARLNVTLASATTTGVALPAVVNVYAGSDSGTVRAVAVDSSGRSVVTVSNFPATQPVSIASVTIGNSITIGSFSTSVTARLINPAGTAVTYAEIGTAGNPSIDVLSIQGVTSGTAVPVSISSVTIGAVPNGALTTRFGSVTTANTSQISSAVTNSARRYLLIQNVTTSSNVITIGIGFTPTTTQGIQLSAGAGITFESSYIPTGAVYILSSVTASPFTILEA